MKALNIALISIIFLGMIISCSYAGNDPLSFKVKELYASPGSSKVVYSIPIDVSMLDVSEDGNWYKVYLKFNLGPLEFKYTGWAYIPVGDILAERENAKVANASK